MPRELVHEPDAHRYVLRIDGALIAVLDYAANGAAVSFTRTYTSPAFRGRGHAAEVVAFAVDDVERTTTRRIVPMCWYVSEWFESHPDRAALLTR
jgi:predicted GNAT family acetyltransferase